MPQVKKSTLRNLRNRWIRRARVLRDGRISGYAADGRPFLRPLRVLRTIFLAAFSVDPPCPPCERCRCGRQIAVPR
jgi:hypothetical protein